MKNCHENLETFSSISKILAPLATIFLHNNTYIANRLPLKFISVSFFRSTWHLNAWQKLLFSSKKWKKKIWIFWDGWCFKSFCDIDWFSPENVHFLFSLSLSLYLFYHGHMAFRGQKCYLAEVLRNRTDKPSISISSETPRNSATFLWKLRWNAERGRESEDVVENFHRAQHMVFIVTKQQTKMSSTEELFEFFIFTFRNTTICKWTFYETQYFNWIIARRPHREIRCSIIDLKDECGKYTF